MPECSFCEALETWKRLEGLADSGVTYKYGAAIVQSLYYKKIPRGRSVNYIRNGLGCPLNFCPECGRSFQPDSKGKI